MKIETYKVTSNCEILDKLFLVGDTLYATASFHVMDGHFDYARKIFTSKRKYLGMIRKSHFPENLLERVLDNKDKL